MKGIDTNILIRFLVGDDELQAKTVYNLFKKAESEKKELFVPLLVMLELIWVLESVYDIPRAEILDSISELLLMPILKFEQQTVLQQCIHAALANNHDPADLLLAHAAKAQRCETVLTFDRKASRYHLFELAQ